MSWHHNTGNIEVSQSTSLDRIATKRTRLCLMTFDSQTELRRSLHRSPRPLRVEITMEHTASQSLATALPLQNISRSLGIQFCLAIEHGRSVSRTQLLTQSSV